MELSWPAIYSDSAPAVMLMMMRMMRVLTASAPRSAQLMADPEYGRFGHPMEITCRGSRNTKPPPRVTWLKDGVAINSSDRLEIESTKSVDRLSFDCLYHHVSYL